MLALRAIGAGPGDEVIAPANSFIATAEAVTQVGATPVLVDVDPVTQLMTAEAVEAALSRRTRGVIPVHLHGRTAELDPYRGGAPDRRGRDRGRLPGPRCSLSRTPCWRHRRLRLLQLLPRQEPGRLGRRRCSRHERSGDRGAGSASGGRTGRIPATGIASRERPPASTRSRRPS